MTTITDEELNRCMSLVASNTLDRVLALCRILRGYLDSGATINAVPVAARLHIALDELDKAVDEAFPVNNHNEEDKK